MKYIKTFESIAYGKTNQHFFEGEVYIIFSDYEGREKWINGVPPNYNEDKKKVLEMLKKYYKISESNEAYMMKERSWAWCIQFYDSFGPQFDVNIISTIGWIIDEKYNQISAEEFLKIGLENLTTYFGVKKYNL